jgi:hypothetical protein
MPCFASSAIVHLVYIIIISHISVLSYHILLRPAMVHLVYIIINSHNLLIFTVLRPTYISTHKTSNKQLLMNLLYISSLFLIIAINAWATYVVNIKLVLWLIVFCSSLQKSFQFLNKTLAHSITDVNPFSIHLQKQLIVITKYRWSDVIDNISSYTYACFFIIILHLDPSISEWPAISRLSPPCEDCRLLFRLVVEWVIFYPESMSS